MRSITCILMCFVSIKLVDASPSVTMTGKQQKQNSTSTFYDGFYNLSAYLNDTDSKIVEMFKQNYPIKLWKQYGLFKEDFITKINVHWLKFPPPSEKTHYFLAALYIVIMILGMFGNAMVVFMISRYKSLRTPANVLVMNLAVSDFLIMSEMPIFVFNSFHRGPVLGEQICRYYGFIGGLSGTVSICTLAAISLDRYYVIKFPLNRRFTNLRAKICVAVTWIYGVIFSSIPLLDIGLGTYVPEGYLTSCSYDYLTDSQEAKLFILVFFIAAWVVPFVLISYCYTTILLVVTTHRRFKSDVAGRDSSIHVKEDEKRKQELKLALVVFLVIGLWFAAWTPYAIVSLLGIYGRKDLIQPFYSMIPALFCKTASCADPFVYAFTHPRFKAEMVKMLGRSERRGAPKVWTTSESNVTPRKGEATSVYSSEPEVEMVVFETRKPTGLNRKREVVQITPKVITDRDMRAKETPFKTPWWYRPSFSNRSSSIRHLQRSFSKNKQKYHEDDIVDYDHVSV